MKRTVPVEQPPTPAPARQRAEQRRGADARMLRIIAGQWRGRRWRFPATDMRPTPDRVRETLFNWLQGRITGSRCLDLFAGSGALGLEALSRGAAEVVFVEQNRLACTALQEVLFEWHAEGARLEPRDALDYLARPAGVGFDIVFVDPPFASVVHERVLAQLAQNGWLRPGALVYMEHARSSPIAQDSPDWRQHRTGHAGEVAYQLLAQVP